MAITFGPVKACPRCRQTKKLDDFHRNRARPDGYADWCKACYKDLSRSKSRKARLRTYRKRWRQNNPDAQAKLAARIQARRAERLLSAPGGAFDANRPDYQKRIRLYRGLCAFCRESPYQELDHRVPLSRGGTNHAHNIFPACRKCNRSKSARIYPQEWTPESHED